MTLTAIISYIINGILMGGLYGLTSAAWSFQCGALKFANFAYGACIMFTMYLTYWPIAVWGWPVWLTLIFVLAFNVLLGWVMRKTVLRPNNRNTQILCTMGLGLIITNLANFFFTSYPRDFGLLEKRIYFTENISIGTTQLFCFALSGAILIGFQFFLNKTWTGRAIRAVVQNRDVASLMGVKSERILDLAFSISYIMIAIAGIMLMTMFTVDPNFGVTWQSYAFIICISAGIGNLYGAFLSGLIVGVVSSLIKGIIGPFYHDPILYALFVVILLLRPYGIFNKAENVARTI